MLTWSSLKAYFRNRGAIFFSLLVPLMIMGIFGLINFGNSTPSVNIGVVDQAHNQVSGTIISSLKGIKAAPDVYLATTRWGSHEWLAGRVVHVVSRQGTPLLYVKEVSASARAD